MPATLIKNIGQLAGVQNPALPLRGKQLAEFPSIHSAFLIVEDSYIVDFGSMKDLSVSEKAFAETYDAAGRLVHPAWCDSHTHLVFSGSREDEFVAKLMGLTYQEIASRGGGIISTMSRVRAASEDQLFIESYERLKQVSLLGTASIEIKSGYGLETESELKMLRVIRRLKEKSALTIRSTFLGAHTFPPEFKNNREGYISLITDDMLPAIAAEGLADYIDVFCEQNFFTPAETERICQAGLGYGLKAKIHANQLSASGGVEAGLRLSAVSVDHLESVDESAIGALAASSTIGTLLPTAAYFLRMPYQQARSLIEKGAAIALASDFNPGSSPSGNMNFVVSLSCIQMKMLPEEAFNAATINGAFAMEVSDATGSIAIGKQADLIITRPVASLAYIPYAFGTNHIERVMVKGNWVS